MTREELTEKMKDLPNPPCRVNLIQQVWEIMNDENEQKTLQLHKAKEIIKDFILMAKVEHLKDRYETVDETEQFLNNEVEND